MPANRTFTNYTNVGNCSCAACDSACPAPPVDAYIGFFDGFNGGLVAIVYGVLIIFSIVYQIVRKKFSKKNDENSSNNDELEVDHSDNPYLAKKPKGKKVNKINESNMHSNVSSMLDRSGDLSAAPLMSYEEK